MSQYFQSLFVPWKLATLAAGIALLCFGAVYEQLDDWDIGISFLMAQMTFLTAPWVCEEIKAMRWKSLPLAAFFTWATVDGSYWLYNELIGNTVYLRDANAWASLPLYFICGVLWMNHKGNSK